jgi:colanic acid/amylovoran biosynthesis glycosyltransferase
VALPAFPRRLKIAHIFSFYGYDYENVPFTNPTWKKRYEELFRKTDLFFCEGGGAGVLQEMGCPSNKIAIQKLGVDVDSIPFCDR